MEQGEGIEREREEMLLYHGVAGGGEAGLQLGLLRDGALPHLLVGCGLSVCVHARARPTTITITITTTIRTQTL
jgi:hypothetical protein